MDLVRSEVYPRTRALVETYLSSEEKVTSLKTLDDYSTQADAMQHELETLRQWLQNPPPPVDANRLKERSAVPQQDRYEEIESVITQWTGGTNN